MKPEEGLDAYVVGGWVRDRLLGLDPKDRDWVVIGATPDEMLRRGFQQVGKDFPVFLHPQTKEEYALARTERKTGPGYHGFAVDASPGVTLEEDLARRDLTINAMAMTADGRLIDPFHGAEDLRNRVLRHVSPAFVEDPLRVLRLARFAAQLEFDVAPETIELARRLARSGELEHLVPERVWQELQRAMAARAPRRFVEVLREVEALKVLFPEIDALFGIPQPARYHPEIDTGEHLLLALDAAARLTDDPLVRFAVLLHDLGKAATPPEQWPSHRGHEALGVPLVDRLCRRYRVPKHYHRLARRTARHHLLVHRALELKPSTLLRFFEDLDAFRQPGDFERFLLACEADNRGRKGFENSPCPETDYLRQAFAAAREVSASDVSGEFQGKALGEAIRQLRRQRITRVRTRRLEEQQKKAGNDPPA